MSQQSLACRVTEELALITSLRHELETFVIEELKAENNALKQVNNRLQS